MAGLGRALLAEASRAVAGMCRGVVPGEVLRGEVGLAA